MSKFSELLEKFEAVLVEKGFPLNLGMAPSLSRAEIQHVEDEAGVSFPTELVTLYEWKNGPDGVRRDYVFGMEPFDGCDLVSVDSALFNHKRGDSKELVELELELGEELFLYDGGDWQGLRPDMEKGVFWRFAIDGMGTDRFADLAADPHICPVYGTFKQPYDMTDIPVPLMYRSLYDMFHTTLRCFQGGAYTVARYENGNPYVETDDEQMSRIHCEMNPGLPYWEDYAHALKQFQERRGPHL